MSWDDYFMTLAFLAASKSKDPRTKHGSVIVDQENRIISISYNGPAMYCDDKKLPIKDIEKKNSFYCHSERSAMLLSRCDLRGTKLYCTGRPCLICMNDIIQAGISELIYGPVKSHMIENDIRQKEDFVTLINSCNIQIREYTAIENIFNSLENASEYLKSKIAK